MAKGAKTGGRAKGTPNKRTLARKAAMQAAAAKIGGVIESAFEGDAHALLIAVYKNPEIPLNLRVDAAKAAVGYEKPRLNASEHSLRNGEETIGEWLKASRGLPSGL
jgi:hypothetical protein